MSGALPEGITVTGIAAIEVEPDTAYLEIGVQVVAPSVAAAREQAATAAGALVANLETNGLAGADVRTSAFSIQPQYHYPPAGEPAITGYQVTNTVSVRVRELARFAKILDQATGAGGDAARVDSVRFGRDDETDALARARSLAMADARRKAEQLAAAEGVRLGRVLAMEEHAGSASGPYPREAAMLRARAYDAATPIEPGTNRVSVAVTVRYAIHV